MQRLTIAAWFVLLCPALALSASEMEDPKIYGNCLVGTQVDLLTDEEFPMLACVESVGNPGTSITIVKHPSTLGILLSVGLQLHLEDAIPVTIRIDKGTPIHRQAIWKMPNALLLAPDLARKLLHELPRAQRVIIKVGTESAVIPLNGSSRAITDFRRRAGMD